MNRGPLPMLRTILTPAIMLILTSGFAAHADDLGASKAELIRTLLPTVVNIATRKAEMATPAPAIAASPAPDNPARPNIRAYVGSGFVIDATGLIVTNYHVVEDAFEITVVFSDGTRLAGRTLSASRLADLALVKVDPDHPLPATHWGDSDLIQVGDQVFAAGNPFGIGLSVSAGIVSGLNRDIQNSPYDDLIQTDATINHGNSGGPLFDMQGNVVGVDSAIISPTTGSSGLGFAIPSNSARFVIDRLRTYGWVRPGWIGIKLQQMTPDIASALGRKRVEGSIVAWVLPDGPAKTAGLAIGDVVLRYADHTPSDERALLRDIAHTPVGETVILTVQHDGQERTVPVVVQEWPRNQWDARDAPVLVKRPKIIIPPDLGLSLSPLDTQQREQLGIDNGLDGVVVSNVAADTDPAQRGMKNGDVILRVGEQPVATPEAVQSGIDAARAAKRTFVLMLVLPKVRDLPGPKWIALQLETEDG